MKKFLLTLFLSLLVNYSTSLAEESKSYYRCDFTFYLKFLDKEVPKYFTRGFYVITKTPMTKQERDRLTEELGLSIHHKVGVDDIEISCRVLSKDEITKSREDHKDE